MKTSKVSSLCLLALVAPLATGCGDVSSNDADGAAAALNAKHLLTCKQIDTDNASTKLDGELSVDEEVLADVGEALEGNPGLEELDKRVLAYGAPLRKYRLTAKLTTAGKTRKVNQTFFGSLHTANGHHVAAIVAGPDGNAQGELEGPTLADAAKHLYRFKLHANAAALSLTCEGRLPTEAALRNIDVRKGPSYAIDCGGNGTFNAIVANATTTEPALSATSNTSDEYVAYLMEVGGGSYSENDRVSVGRKGKSLVISAMNAFQWHSLTFAAPTEKTTSGLAGELSHTTNFGSKVEKTTCNAVRID